MFTLPIQPKCSQYWPNAGETRTWGHFVTEGVKEETFAEYVIREFTLKDEVRMTH